MMKAPSTRELREKIAEVDGLEGRANKRAFNINGGGVRYKLLEVEGTENVMYPHQDSYFELQNLLLV